MSGVKRLVNGASDMSAEIRLPKKLDYGEGNSTTTFKTLWNYAKSEDIYPRSIVFAALSSLLDSDETSCQTRMLPKISALAFLIAVNVHVLTGEKCDVSQCPSIPKHYEELGCKAVKKAGGCCTSR